MKKFIWLLIAVLLILASCTVTDLPAQNDETVDVIEEISSEPDEVLTLPEPSTDLTRTIMIYIVGSDLESQHGLAMLNIAQMIETDIDLENNNVLIMTGGASEWTEGLIPNDKTMIYELYTDDLIPVLENPMMNMGDESTLSFFLNWVYDNYSSEKYSLIFWNHGAGPAVGFGYDEIFGDILSLGEIDAAMRSSPFGIKNKLEVVGFDACLMSTIEVAHIFQNYGEYFIASQEVIPGLGWNYSFLEKLSPNLQSIELAVIIVDYYFDMYDEVTEYYAAEFEFNMHFELTLSVLDLSYIPELERHLDTIYEVELNNLDDITFLGMTQARSKMKEFGSFYMPESLDLVDITELINLLNKRQGIDTQSISEIINNMIVYNRTNINRANGISIYFPFSNIQMAEYVISTSPFFKFADRYQLYISEFTSRLIDGVDDRLMLEEPQIIERIDENDFFLQLTPEQVETFDRAAYYIMRKSPEGESYQLLFTGTNIRLDDNGGLYANYQGEIQKVVNTFTDDYAYCLMIEIERDDFYVRYHVPVFLTSEGIFKIDHGYLQLELNRATGKADILSIVPFSDIDLPLGSRHLLDMYDYIAIGFMFFSRIPTYDENGVLLPLGYWESDGIMWGNEMLIAEDQPRGSIRFVQDDITDGEEYYIIFSIRDVFGNSTMSNMLPLYK